MGSARNFDPVRLGGYECDAWVAYYRRDWRGVLRSALGMVRVGFGLSWPRTVLGAWWVLRANQAWAPYPDNDPDRARALMCRFYRLVGLRRDPVEAARLEVEWWRVHRARQHAEDPGADLMAALSAVYVYVYDVPAGSVASAARLRAEAMDLSDAWVQAGRDPHDPRLVQERETLVRSYTDLLAAVR